MKPKPQLEISEYCLKGCSSECLIQCDKRLKAALWGMNYIKGKLMAAMNPSESGRLKNWSMNILTTQYLNLPRFAVYKAYRNFFSKHEIEDIEQESFLKLYLNSQEKSGDVTSSFWKTPIRIMLAKHSVFCAHDRYRKIKREKLLTNKMQTVEVGASQGDPVFDRSAEILFSKFMSSLASNSSLSNNSVMRERLIRIAELMLDLSGKWTRKGLRQAYNNRYEDQISLIQSRYALGQIRKLFRDFLEYRAKFGRKFEQ